MDEHTVTNSPVTGPSSVTKLLGAIIVVVIVAVGGFVGGMQYQKGHTTSTAATAFRSGVNGGMGTGRFGGQRMNGSFGSVTAISSTSISISDQRTGTTKTYAITSATTFSSAGSATTASSIAVGDRAIVEASTTNSADAASIAINPSFGGGSNRGMSNSSL